MPMTSSITNSHMFRRRSEYVNWSMVCDFQFGRQLDHERDAHRPVQDTHHRLHRRLCNVWCVTVKRLNIHNHAHLKVSPCFQCALSWRPANSNRSFSKSTILDDKLRGVVDVVVLLPLWQQNLKSKNCSKSSGRFALGTRTNKSSHQSMCLRFVLVCPLRL